MEEQNAAYRTKIDLAKSQVILKSLIQEILTQARTQEALDEFGSNVRDEFKKLKEHIASLKIISLESDNLGQLNSINTEIEEWQKHIKDDHQTFRKALLTAQLNINQRNKEELMMHKERDSEETVRERSKLSRSMMKKTSNQLTDDLLTVTRMVKDNTEKSAKTVDMLVDGSQTINSTKEELRVMGSVIGQAKKILTKYGRRENTDKLLILLGLIFFLASCLVVVRNRYL